MDTKYTLLFTSFGSTFDEAHALCKERNMRVFEPRDSVINWKVKNTVQKVASYDTHWLNIRREDALEK